MAIIVDNAARAGIISGAERTTIWTVQSTKTANTERCGTLYLLKSVSRGNYHSILAYPTAEHVTVAPTRMSHNGITLNTSTY